VLHCEAVQVLVPLQKVLNAMLALSWLYSWVIVKAAICVRHSPQTAHGVRTQPLYLVQVSDPDSALQMQTAPVIAVTSHMRSALLQSQSV
jgi:hypothetical protein